MLSTIDRVLAPLTWVIAALVVLLLFAGPSLIGADKEPAPAAAEGDGAEAAASGSAVFASAGCGGCHTFAAAGASGAVGPNLDDADVDAAGVEAVVRSGRGSMPAFEGQLSDAQIAALAAYVASGGDEGTPAVAEDEPAQGDPEVAATIDAGEGPDGITVADDGTVFVANASAGTLAEIPAGEQAVSGEPVAVGRQPDSPVVAGGVVWLVASADAAVVRVEDGEATTIDVGPDPAGLAVDDESVWVANGGDGTVTRIGRASGEVTGDRIDVGGQPADVAVADGVVWVTDFDGGRVTRIDAASGEISGEPVRVGRRPRGVAIGEGAVWVANAGDGTVTRLDPADGEVVGDPIEVGANPRELAVGAGFVWVANAGDSTVVRIDPASGELAGEPVEVGEDPIGIAVGDGAVWTANFRADTVTKIEF
jgi:DNA-binding beta-propeller fold protein YncE/mono/diheme cytochrome c family protein